VPLHVSRALFAEHVVILCEIVSVEALSRRLACAFGAFVACSFVVFVINLLPGALHTPHNHDSSGRVHKERAQGEFSEEGEGCRGGTCAARKRAKANFRSHAHCF
jgi:hypothetical protein